MSLDNPYQPPREANAPNIESSDAIQKIPFWLFGGVGFLSLIVGIVSRHVRPMIVGPIHYDALVALILEIAMILVAIFLLRRRKTRDAIIYLNIALAAIWPLFSVGWTIRHGAVWNDFVGVVSAFWLGSAVFGSLVMYVMTRRNAAQI
ncbi:MAG: hypothetical protein AAGG48_27790 [Planctomycetota bacterium]